MAEVKLVISEAHYSHSQHDPTTNTGSGEEGTQRALVGVGTDRKEALKIIAEDHRVLVAMNDSNTIDTPVEKVSDEEYKLQGQPMTWKILSVPVNEVINQEL